MSSAIPRINFITSTTILIDMTGSRSITLRPSLIGHFPVVKSGLNVTSRSSVHNRRIDFNHAYQTNYLFLVFIPRIVQVGPNHQRCAILPVGNRRRGVRTKGGNGTRGFETNTKCRRVEQGKCRGKGRREEERRKGKEKKTYPTTKRFQTRTNPFTTY
jgi:hypothetical protein